MTGLFDCSSINELVHSSALLPLPHAPTSPKGVDNFPDEKIETPPTRKDSRVKTKTVLFCSRVRIRRTISRHNMTSEEINVCWYHDEEYDAICRENAETVQRSQESPHVYDEDCYENYCMRGLEHAFGHPLRRRQSLRSKSVTRVLEEQDEQEKADVYDDVSIAKVYSKVSRKCRFRAQVRALRDHSEVEDYLKFEEKETQTRESDFEDSLLQGLDGLKSKKTQKHNSTEGLVRKRAREIEEIR